MAAHRRIRVSAAIVSGKVRETGGDWLYIERGATKMAGDSTKAGGIGMVTSHLRGCRRKSIVFFGHPRWQRQRESRLPRSSLSELSEERMEYTT